MRTHSISYWHLTTSNESIRGLHQRTLSLPPSVLSALLFFFLSLFYLPPSTATRPILTLCVCPSASLDSLLHPRRWNSPSRQSAQRGGRKVMECAINGGTRCTLLLDTFTLCWGALSSCGLQPSLTYCTINSQTTDVHIRCENIT